MGSEQEYVKEFTSMMLEIPNMSDNGSLFLFMDRLQGWTKFDLR